MSHRSIGVGTAVILAAGCVASAGAWAKTENAGQGRVDQIQVNGGTISGEVLQRDGQHVYVRIPRSAVARVTLLATDTGQGDDRLELKDGTLLVTTLLQRDADQLIVQFPRAAVAAVNGEPLPPPVIAGNRAPQFAAVDLHGIEHTLAETQGRVTLVQFWASWCPHCRSDLSLMKQLSTRHAGLRLLTVGIDQDLSALKTFVDNEQVPYPVISAAVNPSLPDAYEMRGVPSYYLIDANGTIVKTWSGSVTESASDFEATVTRLIEQTPAPAAQPTGR